MREARAAGEGDLRAFERLVERYRNRILADCHYLTHGSGDAEDLAQEVFVKAFFGLRSFEGRSTFRHWIQRVKVHHCINHLKRQGDRKALALDDPAVEVFEQLHVAPAAEQALTAAEQRRRVDAVLNRLPPTLRLPLVMRDMDELSYEEIATLLGLGLSAVKMRIKRAREQFRRLYEQA